MQLSLSDLGILVHLSINFTTAEVRLSMLYEYVSEPVKHTIGVQLTPPSYRKLAAYYCNFTAPGIYTIDPT